MITIELKDAEVSAILNRLGAAMADLTPVMQEIGEQLVYETGQRFDQGVTPDGGAWAPKSETTIDAYARAGDCIRRSTIARARISSRSAQARSTLRSCSSARQRGHSAQMPPVGQSPGARFRRVPSSGFPKPTAPISSQP